MFNPSFNEPTKPKRKLHVEVEDWPDHGVAEPRYITWIVATVGLLLALIVGFAIFYR